MAVKTIGILALQGDFEAHRKALERAGARAVEVRTAAELERVDGLVIPGGESTTMLKLLRDENLLEPLRQFGARRPIFGTCAGAILLAAHVTHPEQESLGLMDIDVERNAYGRQLDSRVALLLDAEGGPLEAVFIRAPIIRRVGRGGARAGALQRRPGAGGAGPSPGGDVPSRADRGRPRPPSVSGEGPRMTRVLFVCLGNSCRSQMAEGFARAYGQGVWEVESAGLMPATIIAPLTASGDGGEEDRSGRPVSEAPGLGRSGDLRPDREHERLSSAGDDRRAGSRLERWTIPSAEARRSTARSATRSRRLVLALLEEVRPKPQI